MQSERLAVSIDALSACCLLERHVEDEGCGGNHIKRTAQNMFLTNFHLIRCSG